MTYAVIELSGSQFLVSEGDKLKVNRLSKDEGETFSLVPLLLVSEGEVFIGRPNVANVQVKFKILEHKKDEKIEVRRFKSKSRYRRKKGHRQPVSLVEVVRISEGKAAKEKSSNSPEPGSEEFLEPGSFPSSSGELASPGELGALDLSTRTRNVLDKAGIKTTAELEKMSKEELLKIKGIGEKAVEEIEKIAS